MSKTVFIWDFDGVMADSTPFVFGYWRQAFAQHGIDFKLHDYQQTFTYKFPFDYLHEQYGGTIVKQIYADYSAHEEQAYPDQVEAYPDFVETFKNNFSSIEHHIISSNLASVINPWLQKYQLSPYFKTVTGRETPGYKDEKITKLLTKKKLNPSEAVFIGDTISDMQHAHKAGIAAVGVSWGVHSRSVLKFSKPDIICDTMEDLFELLVLHKSRLNSL